MNFLIEPADNNITVLAFLKKRLSVSEKTLRHWKYLENGICVNGTRVTVRYRLSAGDCLSVADTDQMQDAASYILPSGIQPEILYEDDSLIALNKPPYMPTHPSHGHTDDTLANALATLYHDRGIPFVFRPIGRLDRNTSGIVLCAKTQAAASYLFQTQAEHRIQKRYLAVLDGVPDGYSPQSDHSDTEQTIVCGICRQAESIIMRTVCDAEPNSPAYALTRFRVLRTSENPFLSLVYALPQTGRTHQLRVHFSHIGSPILGDDLYGTSSSLICRHALHAQSLTFPHPFDGMPLTLTSPLPADFIALLPRFGLHSTHDMEVLICEKEQEVITKKGK